MSGKGFTARQVAASVSSRKHYGPCRELRETFAQRLRQATMDSDGASQSEKALLAQLRAGLK